MIEYKTEECEECDGNGYFHCFDTSGSVEKCYTCDVFDSDKEAQIFYHNLGIPEFSYEEEIFRREEEQNE